MKKAFLFVVLAGCSSPPEQPRLQTYGAIFPACLFLCRAAITSAELAEGAAQTTTNQAASSVGSPSP
jgi:hypothetical protein